MSEHQDMVEEFMRSFGQEIPDRPTLKDYPAELRADLILEEAIEYAEASGFMPRIVTDPDGTARPLLLGSRSPDMVEMIDALCDVIYVAYGAASRMGIDLDPFFKEVHRTNMAKLGPDGKPILREDGKFLKPPGWAPPDIAGILQRIRLSAEQKEEV